MIQQTPHTGAEGGRIHGIVGRDEKVIYTDGVWFRKILRREVHLDRGMDLQEKEGMVLIRDDIGAEYILFIQFHTIVSLPKTSIRMGLETPAIKFFTEEFPDKGAIGHFGYGTHIKRPVEEVGGY